MKILDFNLNSPSFEPFFANHRTTASQLLPQKSPLSCSKFLPLNAPERANSRNPIHPFITSPIRQSSTADTIGARLIDNFLRSVNNRHDTTVNLGQTIANALPVSFRDRIACHQKFFAAGVAELTRGIHGKKPAVPIQELYGHGISAVVPLIKIDRDPPQF